jgi:hypothetical protein
MEKQPAERLVAEPMPPVWNRPGTLPELWTKRSKEMNVEIWVLNDLKRLAGTQFDQYPRELKFIYEDAESKNDAEAAERAWSITSAAINRLQGEELDLRLKWESVAAGLTLGVGDVVKIDTRSYVCQVSGFESIASPNL